MLAALVAVIGDVPLIGLAGLDAFAPAVHALVRQHDTDMKANRVPAAEDHGEISNVHAAQPFRVAVLGIVEGQAEIAGQAFQAGQRLLRRAQLNKEREQRVSVFFFGKAVLRTAPAGIEGDGTHFAPAADLGRHREGREAGQERPNGGMLRFRDRVGVQGLSDGNDRTVDLQRELFVLREGHERRAVKLLRRENGRDAAFRKIAPIRPAVYQIAFPGVQPEGQHRAFPVCEVDVQICIREIILRQDRRRFLCKTAELGAVSVRKEIPAQQLLYKEIKYLCRAYGADLCFCHLSFPSVFNFSFCFAVAFVFGRNFSLDHHRDNSNNTRPQPDPVPRPRPRLNGAPRLSFLRL